MLRERFYKIIILFTAISIFTVFSLGYFLIFTTQGSKFILSQLISYYLGVRRVTVGTANGCLAKKLTLQDIRIKNIKNLPPGSILNIQTLELCFSRYNLKGLNVEINGGELTTPDSEPVLFAGSYRSEAMDIRVHSASLDAAKIMTAYFDNPALKDICLTLKDADLDIKGTIYDFDVKGSINIAKFSGYNCSLIECPAAASFSVRIINGAPELSGSIMLPEGTVYSFKQTPAKLERVRIEISYRAGAPLVSVEEGKLVFPNSEPVIFSGEYKNGLIDVNLYSPCIDAKEILEAFTQIKNLKDISVSLRNADAQIRGPAEKLMLSGKFEVDKISYKYFSLFGCPSSFKLVLKNKLKQPDLSGGVVLGRGRICGPQNVEIELTGGSISFLQDPKNP